MTLRVTGIMSKDESKTKRGIAGWGVQRVMNERDRLLLRDRVRGRASEGERDNVCVSNLE